MELFSIKIRCTFQLVSTAYIRFFSTDSANLRRFELSLQGFSPQITQINADFSQTS